VSDCQAMDPGYHDKKLLSDTGRFLLWTGGLTLLITAASMLKRL